MLQNDRIHEHTLFSVMGQKLTGHATALIIADLEADAEYYALHELGFVDVYGWRPRCEVGMTRALASKVVLKQTIDFVL